MNVFARFDENPAMTLRVIKETKHYGRTVAPTDGRENIIHTTNKICGGGGGITRRDNPLVYKGLRFSGIFPVSTRLISFT